MGGSFDILNIGWTAMATHRLASEAASHKTANVATPGYSRQRAELQADDPYLHRVGPLGTGVDVALIGQSRDDLLENRLRAATGDWGFASGRSQAAGSAQAWLGVGEADAVQASLDTFFSAWQALADNPGGAAERVQVLASAQGLANGLAQVRERLDATRRGLDAQVQGTLDELQSRMDEVASLNREIRLVEGAGGQANDLRDQRAQLAKEIAERVGVQSFTDGDGQLNLMLVGGGALVVGDHANRLEASADPANDGLLQPSLSIGGASVLLTASSGGRLGGLLQARDQDIRQVVAGLDQLAYDLVDRVNQVHAAGAGLDGVSGRNLFTPLAAVAGAAGALSLDAAVAGSPDALAAAQDPAAVPGDNRAALAMADLATTRILAGGTRTAGEYWRSTTSALGAGVSQAERALDLAAAQVEQLTAMRESVSGVSIDEEMIELTKAQRAFEAACKVIQTGDELLRTVLELKREA
jgi:flagellar hook-associated protein 1